VRPSITCRAVQKPAPAQEEVIRHIREKLSCRVCDAVIAAPAPDHAIARRRAEAWQLAHIVVSKCDDHLPLNRQAEIFARDGVSLETSTLSGWVGATAGGAEAAGRCLAADILAGDTLHVDDTPLPVLTPGTGKTKIGALWTYVRDERPFAGARPPVSLFFYSPDRKGEHPKAHLKDFRGVIHVDGGTCPRAGQRPDPGAGFNELFASGRIVEAGKLWPGSRSSQDSPCAPGNGAPIGGLNAMMLNGWFAARLRVPRLSTRFTPRTSKRNSAYSRFGRTRSASSAKPSGGRYKI
jgi:transposase